MFEIANSNNPQKLLVKLRAESSFFSLKGFYPLDKNAKALVGGVSATVVGVSSFPDGYSSHLSPNNHIVIDSSFDITTAFTVGISFRQVGPAANILRSNDANAFHTLVGSMEHEISIYADGSDEMVRLRNGVVVDNIRYAGNTGLAGLFLLNGAWHNVALVYNGAWNHSKVYANGVYAGSIPAVPGTPTLAPFLLGTFDKIEYSNNAYMRNFRVYNRDLTAAEIQQIHTVRPN